MCCPYATKLIIISAIALIDFQAAVGAGNAPSVSPAPMISRIALHAELGFLAVAGHTIQFSKSGTDFDYVDNGGQDILFPVSRFSADIVLKKRHVVTLLYQPLTLKTTSLLKHDLSVDDQFFPAGTPMEFLYDFPFYRLSWMYDLADDDKNELCLGLSIQIRNATIIFNSIDGTMYRDNRDIGPVPVLKARGRYTFKPGLWIGTEIDGFYAPVSYLNGSDEEITGAILDASLRAGVPVLGNRGDTFLNLRYLGGGAVGTDTGNTGPGDGYVKNWLHFITVTLGATILIL
jgi:hypothetical protein